MGKCDGYEGSTCPELKNDRAGAIDALPTDSFHGLSDKVLQQRISDALARAGCAVPSQQEVVLSLLGKSVEKLARLAPLLPDGTFSVKDLTDVAGLLGKGTQSDVANLLGGLKSITKNGSHFKVEFADSMSYPLDQNLPGMGGLFKAEKVQFGKGVSFDLKTDSEGVVKLSNLKGVGIDVSTPISNHNIAIKELSMHQDANGQPVLRAKTEDPAPILRTVLNTVPVPLLGSMIIPREITLSAKMGDNGKIVVEREQTAETSGRELVRRAMIAVSPILDLGTP